MFFLTLLMFLSVNVINGRKQTMRIDSKKGPCTTIVPTQCLQIQEGAQIGGDKWFNFYGSIDGFNYEEGYIYKIRVETYDIANPPADASGIGYKLIKIISKKSDDEKVIMMVNSAKGACFGIFPTQCLQVQEGDEIGGDKWSNFYGSINGFHYEEGYIYKLRVRKYDIPNPPADASSIGYDLIQIISKKADDEIITMRVNSQKVACTTIIATECLQIEEGDKIGSGEWSIFYNHINGFNYEEGYIYKLKVRKYDIPNPPQDASSIGYDLVRVVSKKAV